MDNMNIYQKLQKCRVELQQKNLKKSGMNNGVGYKYYELADFLPTVNELFDKYGLCSNFSINSLDQASLTIFDVDHSDQSIIFESPIASALVGKQLPIQALGSQHTYMKRYLYMNALEIIENDYIESIAGRKDTVSGDEFHPVKERTLQEARSLGISLNALVMKYGKDSISELTEEEVQKSISIRKNAMEAKNIQ